MTKRKVGGKKKRTKKMRGGDFNDIVNSAVNGLNDFATSLGGVVSQLAGSGRYKHKHMHF